VCGIVGILARDGSVPADVLERATNSLAHRGPDDAGTILIRDARSPALQVGLGNRRLAILDLSQFAHQPMHDPETGNWIVYNGEIYNFRDLRTELEDVGVTFVSRSDTEVLLNAYRVWGEACLERLNGMFAFALWDAPRQRLFLARDPMGVKPLYYFAGERYFLFASEVRTLLGTGLVPRKLDSAGLLNYLTFGSVCDPNTLIDGVRSVRAGHSLVWERGAVREQQYWDLPTVGNSDKGAERRVPDIDPVREDLFSAVRLQMVSDVPVGIFLSGGIDSSSLVAILSSAGEKLSTFSLVFRESGFSEAEHSRAIATKFHTDHHEISIRQQDALEAMPAAIAAMDQPTMDGVNTYLVTREARAADLKVALSGLGADEVFAGYTSFHDVPRMERFYRAWHHVPDVARRSVGGIFDLLAPLNDKTQKLSALVSENGRLLHSWFLSRMLFVPAKRGQLFPTADAESIARAEVPLRQALSACHSLDAVNQVSYLESRCYMLNTLLRDSDSMSMAHGFELRVPFLDRDLVRKVFSLPGGSKRAQNCPKPLLVRALANALPKSIVHRRKQGFTLPFDHWMRDEMRVPIEASLTGRSCGPLSSVLNPHAVGEVWSQFMAGQTSWSRPWALHVLDRWCAKNL
jgi:asparagine synthase (glutamine-hydrolysing)